MNIKQRAQELLTCDELRGRVPEEVQEFLRDVVALRPVAAVRADTGLTITADRLKFYVGTRVPRDTLIYALGAHNDPA